MLRTENRIDQFAAFCDNLHAIAHDALIAETAICDVLNRTGCGTEKWAKIAAPMGTFELDFETDSGEEKTERYNAARIQSIIDNAMIAHMRFSLLVTQGYIAEDGGKREFTAVERDTIAGCLDTVNECVPHLRVFVETALLLASYLADAKTSKLRRKGFNKIPSFCR